MVDAAHLLKSSTRTALSRELRNDNHSETAQLGIATVVIAAWEKDLDHAKAKEVLYGKFIVDVTAG